MEFLLISGGLALLTCKIANDKGHAPGKWFVFGFLFPLLALIIAAIVDDYVPPRKRSGNPYEPDCYDPPLDLPSTENGRAA